MTATNDNVFSLSLTNEERDELQRLLEQSCADIHSESRRTESASYREGLHRQEAVVRRLAEKVRQLGG